jgi:hypothetical protein
LQKWDRAIRTIRTPKKGKAWLLAAGKKNPRRGVLRKVVRMKEPVVDDLIVGLRRRFLSKSTHDIHHNIVAARDA